MPATVTDNARWSGAQPAISVLTPFMRHDPSALLRALDVLVDGLAGGPFDHEAVRYAREALALDPYRETTHVRLMRLHMSRGNRAEALRAYERCRDILARDLGATPSRQTESAYREVLGA